MKLEYRLMQDDILLGELFDQTVDQPWFNCKFVPTPAFEEVRALFNQAHNHIGENDDAFGELERLGVWLADAHTNQRVVPKGWLLCHIQGNEAWFRM